MRDLKAIVFDYNGTLVDDLHLHVEAYYQAGRRMGFDVSRETVQRHISQPPSRKRLLYYGAISDAQWGELSGIRRRIYLESAERDPAALLFADTPRVMSVLARHFALGVLSNTFRELFERVFPPTLSGLFAATLFFDEVPEPKPSPAPLLALLRQMGVAPQVCGYVGDALEDVAMARAAGVRAFAVATGSCTATELAAAGAEWVGSDLCDLAARLLAAASGETA
ncbi:MAG: HAD family hydrolase [Desulfobacterales bacterium]